MFPLQTPKRSDFPAKYPCVFAKIHPSATTCDHAAVGITCKRSIPREKRKAREGIGRSDGLSSVACVCLCTGERRDECVRVMRECLLVLAPVVSNPSPEARISSSLSPTGPRLSLATHLVMRALIDTGTAILCV